MISASGGGPNGTMLHPITLDATLQQVDPKPHCVPLQLGYERIPSTQVLGFTVKRSFECQIIRRGDDPYLVHVQITMVRLGERRTVYAITTANGIGELATLPAGEYRVICAIGIPEQVNLEVCLLLRPVRTQLGRLIATGTNTAFIHSVQSGVGHLVASGSALATATLAPTQWGSSGPTHLCDSGDWIAQINNGVVELNPDAIPFDPLAAADALLGVCGGDFDLGRGFGMPNRSANGGDFDAGTPVLYPYPQFTDGGDFDAGSYPNP